MTNAAAVQNYELAAVLRNTVDDLFWLQERLAWLQKARREYSFVYPVDSGWYLIRGGRVLFAVPAPGNTRPRRAAAKAIDAVFPSSGGPSIVPNELYDHVLLVSGWFRRRSDERGRVYSPTQ